MSNEILEYRVIGGLRFRDLEREVNKLIEAKMLSERWVPTGGVSVCVDASNNSLFYQAMTKVKV